MSARVRRADAKNEGFLAGGGEMAELISRVDWSSTSLGPITQWPQSLRTTVSLCLASNFPINIIWGPDALQIYNDGYRIVCGEAHPRALGESYTVTWESAWPAIGQPFERARTGETSYLENQRMFLFRNGYLEETFFTFSLSPIRDESGGIGGLFHPVTETTASMLAERRTRCLRDVNASLGETRTTHEVWARAMEMCGAYAFDLPFMLFYARDDEATAYRLVGQVGLEAGGRASPRQLALDAQSPWPVAKLASAHDPIMLDALQDLLAEAPCGPYEEPPHTAFALPITLPGQDSAAAFVIGGVSARLPLDDTYGAFYSLLAAAIGAGFANARTYEEERRRAEALAALDRAKTTFFSNVSHEFRTPLTLMLGPIEDSLNDPDGLGSVHRERLDVAHRNALRLLKLVNSLLDFSRIEAGRIQARFTPTDLSAFTADLASTFRSACERADLALSVDCPPLAEVVFVDRDMWEKVVLNLISNAFKFTLEGGIEVSLRAVGDGVELAVRDTGVGIPEAELPRVLERFHRIEGQHGRTHEGTGIGLALVDELVKLHGGAIAVESRLGEGSTFRVTLPFGSAHLPPEHLSPERTLASTAIAASAYVAEALRWLPGETEAAASDHSGPIAKIEGRPLVVLADDNADMRAYVRRLLEDGGYEVRAAADGQAALKVIRAGPRPDLVLTDVMMPRLDGFGLLAAVRADPALERLLVILLSARAGEEARVEGLAAGADDYLVKPFSARELRARVDGAVSLSRHRREAARREADLRAQIVAERGRAALEQSERDLALALDAGRLGSWSIDLKRGGLVASPLFRRMMDIEDDAPVRGVEALRAHVHRDDQERLSLLIQRATRDRADLDCEFRVVRGDGDLAWILARGRASHDRRGRATRLTGVTLDVTARKQAEERQRLLLDELNHRVKNTLATVQSLAQQTGKSLGVPTGFDQALQARLAALAKAHDLLSESAWEGASLADLIERTLAPYAAGGERVRMGFDGPRVRLGANAAVTLNMAFHELATNAAKYGALSAAGGWVDIGWRMDDRTVLEIDWRESGGPTVASPAFRGFGSRLIEHGVPRELDGVVKLSFPPEGVRCHMRLPLSAKLGRAA